MLEISHVENLSMVTWSYFLNLICVINRIIYNINMVFRDDVPTYYLFRLWPCIITSVNKILILKKHADFLMILNKN